MAGTLTLACKGTHLGNFSQVKKTWEALVELESTEKLDEHLLLIDKRPEAREQVVQLTYSRLCQQLKLFGRADIRDARDSEPIPIKYAIWSKEMNVVDVAAFMEATK